MSIEDLQGRVYRQTFRTDRSAVRNFVDASGDDPRRWSNDAPPSMAAAALFSVAPDFLYDDDVGDFSRVLIHADQTFRWLVPWETGADHVVTGTVERVRMRSGSAWVAFSASVRLASSEATVVESESTFVMSDQRPTSTSDDRPEPAALEKAVEQRPAAYPAAGPLPETTRSASRLDLVRYAAASGDFNPLHWDRDTARNAGLPGVVVHGLLMASWMMQVAVATVGPDVRMPLREARFRFRNPLPAASAASITGDVGGPDRPVKVELRAMTELLMSGTITVER